MAQYQSLAALRGALTSDNPDVRGDAYSAVYEAPDLPDGREVKPSAVLQTDPEDAVIASLEDAEVLPSGAGEQGMGPREWRREAIGLLEEIAANTGGS